MTQHTPEPWRTEGGPGELGSANCVYSGPRRTPDNPSDYVCSCLSREGYSQTSARPERGYANAARIVACVNACTGMADPAKEIERLRRCEAELDAATSAMGTLDCPIPNGNLCVAERVKWMMGKIEQEQRK